MGEPWIAEIFEVSADIRYVAVYLGGQLESAERPGLSGASSSESDRYEELIVNPTLVKLVTQRGNIDCGGLQFMLIRYGNFFQCVQPVRDGHISVAIQTDAEPLPIVARVRELLERRGMLRES